MTFRHVGLTAIVLGIAGVTTAHATPETPDAQGDYVVPSFIGMTEENIGVLKRARPEYDPKGLPFGDFRLFPVLAVLGSYDSNVFRTEQPESDEFLELSPSMRLISQWSRNLLEFYGGANNYEYAKLSSQNLTDWNVGSDGRLDVTHAAFLTANVMYGEMHEPNWSPDVIGSQLKPNRYYQAHVDATGTYQPNRLGLGWGGTFDRYDWLSTPLIGGGILSNADRSMDEYQTNAKVFYDFSPGYAGLVRATYDSRQFDQEIDRFGFDRSSTGYRVDVGLDVQLTHLVHGEIFGGYLAQNFNAPLPDVSAPDFGVTLAWYATPLLTLHLYGKRQLTDTIIFGASISDDKSIGISADYELLRDLIVQAHANYMESHFVGTSRTDDLPDVGIGVKYLINRYLSADLNYDYSSRSTNLPGLNFTDSTASVGLEFHP